MMSSVTTTTFPFKHPYPEFSILVADSDEKILYDNRLKEIQLFANELIRNDEKLKDLAKAQNLEIEYDRLNQLYNYKTGRDFPYGEYIFKDYQKQAKKVDDVLEKLKIYKRALTYWKKSILEEDPFVADDPEITNRLIPLLEYEITLIEIDNLPTYYSDQAKLIQKVNNDTIGIVQLAVDSISERLSKTLSTEDKIIVLRNFIKVYKQQVATPYAVNTGSEDKGFLKPASTQILDWLNIEYEYWESYLNPARLSVRTNNKNFGVQLTNSTFEELFSFVIDENKTSLQDFKILLTGNYQELLLLKGKIFWKISNKAIAFLFETLIDKKKLSEMEYAGLLEKIESYNKYSKLLTSQDIRSAKNSYLNKGEPEEAFSISQILSKD